MSDPTKYEDPKLYQRRRQALARRAESYLQKPPRADLTPKREPESPLSSALGMLGRPLQATSSAIGYGLSGRDPLEGLVKGIQGETDIRGMADVLKQQGVPELGKLETPMGDITGRGALGFALDLPADPLSYLPVFTAAKYGAKGARALSGGAKALPEGLGVSQILKEGFQETLPGTGIQMATKIPVIGKLIKTIANVSSPKILASNITRRFVAYQGAEVAAGSRIELLLSRFIKDPIEAPIDDLGRISLINGDVRAYNDVWEKLPRYAGRLSEHDYQWFSDAQAEVKKAKQAWDSHKAQLADVNSQAVKDFDFKEIELELGQEYMPRKALPGEEHILPTGQYRGGPTRKTFEHERDIPEAIMRKEGYDKPLATLRQHLFDVQNEINLMDLSRELTPLAKTVAKKRPKSAKGVQWRGLKGLWFTPEDATELQKLLDRQPNMAVKAMQDIGAASRTMGTSFDLSAAMIQGLPEMALNPVKWFKDMTKSWHAAADPLSHARWLADDPAPSAALAKFPNLIIRGARPIGEMTPTGEMFAGMGVIGKTARAVPGVGGVLEKGLAQTIGRGQAAFDAFGDRARVYLANALAPLVKEGDTLAVGDFINWMTGAMDLQAMGISPTQRSIEGAFIFFAPAFTRACFAVVGSIFKGDVTGEMARWAMINMLAAGVATYAKVARAAGQEPVYDPGDSRFLTIQAGTQRIGIAGPFSGLAKLLARGTVNYETNQIDFTQTFRTDPLEFNPLLRFWRGRTAPLGGSAWDIISGTDYLGEELENPLDWTKYLGTKFLPFAVQGLLLDPGPWGDKIASAAAQEFGFKGYPTRYKEVREVYTQEKFGKSFDELDPYQRQEILNLPELTEMPLRGEWGKQEEQRRGIAGVHAQRLEEVAQKVKTGELTESHYREKRGEINRDMAAQMEMLQGEPKTPEERERWLAGLTPQERAYQQYLEIFRTPNKYDETQFDLADAFYASLPPEIQQYIDDKQLAKAEQLGPDAREYEREYRRVAKLLKPYWEIRDEYMEMYGLKEMWDEASPAEREELERSRLFSRARARWTKARRRFRMGNPEIDAILVKWYGLQPIR